MTFFKTILPGSIVWLLIFISFMAMSLLPVLQDAKTTQNIIILILIIPFVVLGNLYYHSTFENPSWSKLSFVIILTCLFLDAIITLPLVILPEGGSYYSFYTDPGLVIMGLEIMLICFMFHKVKNRFGS